MKKINKVVLAFSGGLDTSVILKWLQDTYQCEVVTFTADIGQGEEVEPARAKATCAETPRLWPCLTGRLARRFCSVRRLAVAVGVSGPRPRRQIGSYCA